MFMYDTVYIIYDAVPLRFLYLNQGYADLFCEAIHRSTGKNDDFVIECVGIVGNLTIPELDYEMLLFQYDLLGFMKKKLSQGKISSHILNVILL